jgi:hypothetical protein
MRIVGEWFVCTDGILRPTVVGYAADVAGTEHEERFLLDSGADATVFTAGSFQSLGLPTRLPATGVGLSGVGGGQASVLFRTTLTLYADDGNPARIQGDFAAFTDPAAADMSILGRDVLDHFDVIISRRRHEVLLLATNHTYHIQPP